MRNNLTSIVAAFCLAASSVAGAETLDQTMPGLAEKLSKALVAQGSNNIAAVDFTDLQGQPTELGRYLSERLAVEVVLTGAVTVVDRANIKSILAEHKLTEAGLVNPANAKKLGEFAGVDAIMTGNVSEVDAGWELLVKVIATETAKIVAAGRVTFAKTSDNQTAGSRGISDSSGPTNSSSAGVGLTRRNSYQEARAIATKNFGSLRVILKSVMPIELTDQYGRSLNGIRISVDFINRDTKKSMVVAMNAESRNQNSPAAMLLRTRLLDDRGNVWNLSSSNLGGLGFVCAGVHGRNGQETYSASEIVRLLRLRDSLGRDDDDPSDGTSDSGGFVQAYRPPGSPSAPPQTFFPFKGNTFVSGSTTSIEPGQNQSVIMDFVSASGGNPTPNYFQFAGEVVTGVVSASKKTSYSLESLTFDRVNLPTQ